MSRSNNNTSGQITMPKTISQCGATLKNGNTCKNKSYNNGRCGIHSR